MLRIKICAMLTLIVVMVMTAVYMLLPQSLDDDIRGQARSQLEVATLSMERYERLNDFGVTAKAERIAAFRGLQSALVAEYNDPYEYHRHLGVHEKGILRWKFAFENLAGEKSDARAVDAMIHERPPYKPEMVFVADEKGVGVAALGTNKYDWYKEDVAARHPEMLAVKDGVAREGVWYFRWSVTDSDTAAWYHVGIAPVMQGPEKLIGHVVVGSLIAGGTAQSASANIGGADVAYFNEGKIFASTLKGDEALSRAIFEAGKDKLAGGGTPPPFTITHDGSEYLVAVRYFSSASADKKTGFVVLSNMTTKLATVQKVKTSIFVVGPVILIILLGAVLIVIRSFVKAFEDIDQGIQEVIAGNKDYEFQVSGNHAFQSEMAQSLNLMSAFLQGKRMPDEEDDEVSASGWGGGFEFDEISRTAMIRATGPLVTGVPMKGAPTEELEPLDEYRRRVFDEYVAARRNLGLGVDDLTFDKFVTKLSENTVALKRKHEAKDVRFSVVVRDGKVVLKPQPIF
jgi:hypothetical protein